MTRTNEPGAHRFRFTVLARYPSHRPGGEAQVAINLAAGHGDHMVLCGTLTMSEGEWATLSSALRSTLGEAVEMEDRTVTPEVAATRV
jgi:hypothetical protein